VNRPFDRGRKLAHVLLIFSMLTVLSLIILGVAALF
jgi:hypothetical protein